MVFYLYVVDERRHLVGVISLRRLLLVSPETPLQRIMTSELISARVDTDQEEVAQEVANYNLLAIPVVDAENKLVGIITVDDVIDFTPALRAEALELTGRPQDAGSVRLDSLGWARYGFGPDWAVRAKLNEISALRPASVRG